MTSLRRREDIAASFDAHALRTAWRKRCAQIAQASGGKITIDPSDGISSTQLSNLRADIAKATHVARQARMLRRFAAAHPGQMSWRVMHERSAPDWWQHTRLWRYGKPRRLSGNANQLPPDEKVVMVGQPESDPEVSAMLSLHEGALAREMELMRTALAERYNWPRSLLAEVLIEDDLRARQFIELTLPDDG